MASDRRKAERLESIMAKHMGSELKTLADLRVAGFRFRTIDQAWRRLAVQRRMHGFTQAQIDAAVRALSFGQGKEEKR